MTRLGLQCPTTLKVKPCPRILVRVLEENVGYQTKFWVGKWAPKYFESEEILGPNKIFGPKI